MNRYKKALIGIIWFIFWFLVLILGFTFIGPNDSYINKEEILFDNY